MRRLKSDIVYEIGATTVTTTPPMSFALRRGVCQDFAHIMISGLRGIGLPAGYVSGYLRSALRTDATRLQGADAMHAWVLVWCGPQAGWIGLDPTNAVLASDEHIVLALGRDYTDVAPMDGVVVGSGGQRIEVGVSVTPVASLGIQPQWLSHRLSRPEAARAMTGSWVVGAPALRSVSRLLPAAATARIFWMPAAGPAV